MKLRELLKAAKEFKPTEEDVKAMAERLRARQKEWEKQELEKSKKSREFLNRTYTL